MERFSYLTAEDGADSTKGIFGDAGTNNTTAQIGYDGDNFGGAITYLSSDTNSSATDFTALGVGAYSVSYTHLTLPTKRIV